MFNIKKLTMTEHQSLDNNIQLILDKQSHILLIHHQMEGHLLWKVDEIKSDHISFLLDAIFQCKAVVISYLFQLYHFLDFHEIWVWIIFENTKSKFIVSIDLKLVSDLLHKLIEFMLIMNSNWMLDSHIIIHRFVITIHSFLSYMFVSFIAMFFCLRWWPSFWNTRRFGCGWLVRSIVFYFFRIIDLNFSGL